MVGLVSGARAMARALATWLFLVADFSELRMLYLQSSNRISLSENVSSNVPNSSGGVTWPGPIFAQGRYHFQYKRHARRRVLL